MPDTQNTQATPAPVRAAVSQDAAKANAPTVGLPPDAKLIDATYAFKATALGISACEGTMQVQVNAQMAQTTSAQMFQVPQGIVSCPLAGTSIDLAQVMAAYAQVQSAANVKDPYTVADGVIGLHVLGGNIFTPARPMLPSFLASTKEQLANLNVTRQVSVTTADGKTGHGTITLHMLSYGQSYTSATLGKTFNNVMDFEVTADGFDGIDQVLALLVPKMGFKISLSPIAIIEIRVSGKADKFLKATEALAASGSSAVTPGLLSILPAGGDAQKAKANGDVLGSILDSTSNQIASAIDVNATFTLTAQPGLDAPAPAAAGFGEAINGKKTGN